PGRYGSKTLRAHRLGGACHGHSRTPVGASGPARRSGTASNSIRPGRDIRATPGRSDLSAGGGGGRARGESRCRLAVPLADARVSYWTELRSPGRLPAPDRPLNGTAPISQSGSAERTTGFHRG